MTHYTVRSIIDDLKLATSFVEAQNVLKTYSIYQVKREAIFPLDLKLFSTEALIKRNVFFKLSW